MTWEEKLAALQAEGAELRKKLVDTPDQYTDEDGTRAEEILKGVKEARDRIAALSRQRSALDEIASAAKSTPTPKEGEDGVGRSLGEAFVNSEAYKAMKARGISDGAPVSMKSGPLHVTRKADPAPLSTEDAQGHFYVREPGITDLTYRKPAAFLDLITRGTTASRYLEYRQLTSVTSAAAQVAEKGLKPLSQLGFTVAQAAVHLTADGFKVTNQELRDDGVIATLINSTLESNLDLQLQDQVLNGDGTGENHKGIFNTTGVLTQAFATDMVTTVRKAITKLQQTAAGTIQAVLLNPEDDEAWDLLKDSQGRFLGAGPYGSGPTTAWGYPRIGLSSIPKGKALLGDFKTIQLLNYTPRQIQVFNQNEDDARHNLAYIRAEEEDMLIVREPAKLLIANIAGE